MVNLKPMFSYRVPLIGVSDEYIIRIFSIDGGIELKTYKNGEEVASYSITASVLRDYTNEENSAIKLLKNYAETDIFNRKV